MSQKQYMKTRWANCEKIADKLSSLVFLVINKHEVNQYLYKDITNTQFDKLMEGDKATVEEIVHSPGFKQLIEAKERRKNVRIHEEGREYPQTPAQQIKLAMWFIDKVGDYETALKVLKAAGAAMRELEKKDNV